MPGPQSKGKTVGDALLAFYSGRLDDLNLVSMDWYKGVQADPVNSYPAVPYTMCPRFMLRARTFTLTPGPPRGGMAHDVKYTITGVLQLRQTPGEDHQEQLILAAEKIINPFTEAFLTPVQLQSIDGFKLERACPQTCIIHPELRHKFDDPKLRISVAEIEFLIEGKINSCM